MKLLSAQRLREISQRGRKHNELMLTLANIRVNGHASGMKITMTGKGTLDTVKIEDSLRGKTTEIETSFLHAYNDARTKLHDLKRYHWELFYEGPDEQRDFKRFEEGHPNSIPQTIESLANDADSDPLPPFTYDTSLEHIEAIDQFCTEKNIDYAELLENWSNCGSYLRSKGVDPVEFEDRVLVKMQNEEYKLSDKMKEAFEHHMNDFLQVEGKYDILNMDEVDLRYVENLEKERRDAVWTHGNEKYDIESRRNLFGNIQKQLIDPEFHGIINGDDIEAIKRLILDTDSDLVAMFENTPGLKDMVPQGGDMHHSMTSSNEVYSDPMPEAHTIEEAIHQYKEAALKINSPPKKPIETIEEFKKLNVDEVDLIRALTSENLSTIVDMFSREEVKQYSHFLKEKFGFTGTFTPEIKEAMEKADPELAKQIQAAVDANQKGKELAAKWHKEHPHRGLLYSATASEIAQLLGLSEEQKQELIPTLSKLRTPL